MSNEEEIKAELERLKREKVISEQTAQVYLSEVRKKFSLNEQGDQLEEGEERK